MDAYQTYIHKSRYARYLPDQNRRESWEETISRYVNFMEGHLRENCNYRLSDELKKSLYNAIYKMEIMPSMRAVMTAGKALERDNTAGYNCFGGSETFITSEGIKSFSDAVNTTVSVLTMKGWKNAEIKSFGIQQLQKVTFRPTKSKSNIRRHVSVTANHRWLTKNRGMITDLKVGDVICSSVVSSDNFIAEAFIRGFGFGDGTLDSRGRARIRLCGEKVSKWKKTFEEYGNASIWQPGYMNGDVMIVYHKGHQKNWKTLPYNMMNNLDYLTSWLSGYMAADASGDTLSSQDSEAIEFVEKIAPLCGFIVTGKNTSSIMETNYGIRKSPLTKITLKKSCEWYVTNIEELDEDEVYCAVEPETQTFSLGFGCLTGNCAYLVVDDPKAFDEAMFILMCGTGVGFSVERQYVNKLPEIPDELYYTDTTIQVKDSKEGWAKSFRMLVAMLYAGEIPKWDISKVRPAGAPLKVFGGRASGPEPLEELFKYTIRIFINAKGRRLTSLEAHDIMCKIAEVVVVGGVRRSAMISLSNLSDDRMRHAKAGAWWEANVQRALSNNSAVYTEKPDVGLFMQEWLALYESKSGERGIFNREASQRVAGLNGRRDTDHEFGTNPCSEIILRPYQFCVAPTTPLITSDGIYPISSIENKSVKIWNGEEWTSVIVRKTGTNQKLMRVLISDGSYIDCTPDHRWSVKDRFMDEWKEVQTKDLLEFSKYSVQIEPANVISPREGDEIEHSYTLGFAVGDGCVYKDRTLIDLHGEKDWSCPVEGTRYKPRKNYAGTSTFVSVNATKFAAPEIVLRLKNDPEYWNSFLGRMSRNSVLNFIAGLADADGAEAGTGGIRMYINSYDKCRSIQLVLAKHGIRCSINLHQREGTVTNLSVRKRDSWYVQITDCREIPCHRLDVSEGHLPKYKGKYQTIVDVFYLDGEHDTYCFTEPKRHKAMFGNVLTYQCNLTEVVVRAGDTVDDLESKVRLATVLGTFQSTLTDFPYLRKIWKKNTEEERLLGVSLTGIYDSALLNDYHNVMLPNILSHLRQTCIDTNKELAEELDIPVSTAITCVKPSGTVSQLVDSASGIHPRHDSYYLRRVRSDNKDPLTKYLIDAGVPSEPDVTKPHAATVFTFAKKAPDGAKVRSDVSAIDHLELWLMYQRYWCEHKPSVTINVKESEWPEVGAWIWKHFDEVSGVSFLPFDGGTYRQAPYETIRQEEYEEWIKKIPDTIDWNGLKETEDNVEGVQTLACSSGNCEV